MDNPRNPGLIGRDDVLAQLVRAVEELAGGRGGLVLLTGEAGIGKSAVVAAAAATAQGRGARVVWGWGWPGEGMPAYWPWVQVFRSLVAAGGGPPGLAAGASSLARLLPELPGTADGPATGDELTAAARFRLLDELATILLAAAAERPLVVVPEDLQWADAPSLQLLDFLARRLPASRVLVLGTWRDLEQPKGDPLVPLLAGLVPRSTVVALGPLAGAETARLVAELAAATGLGGRARRLGDQSERARKTVTARIRDVIDRVERVHPALGAHLRASVTTGTFCSYSPPTPTAWEL